jgi:hypothetical protein
MDEYIVIPLLTNHSNISSKLMISDVMPVSKDFQYHFPLEEILLELLDSTAETST